VKRALQLIGLLLLASTVFYGCGRKPGPRLYREALEKWRGGNPVRARVLMEEAIRRQAGSEDNAAAYNQLGLLLWEMNEAGAAAEAFSESCRLDAGRYDVLCNLGVALAAQGRYAEAERVFREAALLRPADTRPLEYAGTVYLKNKKWSDARRNLQRAVERAPADPRLQTALALTELHATSPDLAARRLEVVTKTFPGYAPAWFNLAGVYLYWKNNPVQAERCFRAYLAQTAAADPFVSVAEGALASLVPAAEEAVVIKSVRPRNREAAQREFDRALEHQKAKRYKQAAEGYIAALETDDSFERAWHHLGLVYYSSGDLRRALFAFTKAVENNPAFTSARYNRALTHYQLGQTSAALQDLSTVLAQQPSWKPARDLAELIKQQDR